MITLESFEISGFRGIRKLPFTMKQGKALLLHGLNGTGKSSLHQALTFAFTGSLPPVAESSAEVSAKVFRHAALDENTPAWVYVRFTDGTNEHWIKREIGPTGAQTVQSSSQTALALAGESLNGFCFITRRQFATMVDAVERDSWTRLTPFLGHHELSRLREGLRGLSNQIRRDLGIAEIEREITKLNRSLEREQGRLRVALGQIGRSEFSPQVLSHEFAELIPGTTEFESYDAVPWDELESRLPASARSKELTQSLLANSEEQSTISHNGSGSLLAEAIEFGARLTQESGLAHSLVHAGFLVASQGAVEGFSTESCPLCGLEPVDWDKVRRLLASRSESLQTDLNKLKSAKASITKYSLAISELGDRLQHWIMSHDARPEMIELKDQVSALEELVRVAERRLMKPLPEGLSEQERKTLEGVREATTAAHKALNAALKVQHTALVKEQDTLPGTDELRRFLTLKEAAKIDAECVRLKLDVQKLDKKLTESERIATTIQTLSTVMTDAESELSTSLLAELESEVRRIFGILTDNHQLHPRIRIRTERGIRYADIEIANFYGLGAVMARDYLSEANRNSLGLAIYFAGLLRRKPGLKLLVIDDITHSADNVHRRGLAQFIANELVPGLQMIVLTHDDNWHSRLKQTLPPQGWTELQVINWSPDGLTLRTDNWSSLLAKAEAQIIANEASGGNTLRQALEQFVDDACERYNVLVPYRRSSTGLSFNDKRTRLETALKEAWSSGKGLIDPNALAIRLLVTSQQIANLASHYGSYESWSFQDLKDTLQDVKDVIEVFSCKHQVGTKKCGALLSRLTKEGNGTPPVCKNCSQQILL